MFSYLEFLNSNSSTVLSPILFLADLVRSYLSLEYVDPLSIVEIFRFLQFEILETIEENTALKTIFIRHESRTSP